MSNNAHAGASDTGSHPGSASGTPGDTPLTDVRPLAEQMRAAGTAAVFDGYDVLGEIGRGGMGVVYRARHRATGTDVALKVVKTGGGPRTGLRFLAEAEAVAAIEHPHVVRVVEVNRDPVRPFIAFEYLANGTLAERLRQPGGGAARLAPAVAAAVVRKLAAGAAAAHATGIVHRDIKPANVMFDAADEPKLTDFGIAKRPVSDLTVTGDVFGTPGYMSPEQADGNAKFVGPPADVWALGVLLYEMLTGTPPFATDTPAETLRRVREAVPPNPRALVPDLPRHLEFICLHCLEKEPQHRYPTAAALADDLGRFLAGRPPLCRPPGPMRRAGRWVRRNPLPAGVVVLLLAVAGSALFALDRERERRRLSEAVAASARSDADKQFQAERATHAIHLAGSNGDFQAVEREYKAAADRGLVLGPPARLWRVRAVHAAADAPTFQREFDGLDIDALPDEFRGWFELWKGISLFGADDAEAERLIRRARGRYLPPADREYAEGALTEKTPDALKRFQAAYRLDPWHKPARGAACSLLILSGELEKAIELADESAGLFPTAPDFPAMAAIALALLGRNAEAEERMRQADDKLPFDTCNLIRSFNNATPALFRVIRANHGYGPRQAEDETVLKNLGEDAKRHGIFAPRGRGAQVFASMPPAHRRLLVMYLDLYIASLAPRLGNFRLFDPPFPTDRHPEGFLLFRQMMAEYDRASVTGSPDERFVKLQGAAKVAERAAAARSLFPVNDMAADMQVVIGAALADRAAFGDRVDARATAETLKLLRERTPKWEDQPPARRVLQAAVELCKREEKYDQARVVLVAWEKVPGDLDAARKRAEIEFAAKAYPVAQQYAQTVLDRDANDARMKKIRDDCQRLLAP